MSKKVTKKTTKKSTKKPSKKSTKKTTKKSSSNIIDAGDFIKIEFTGRIKDTGAVYSTSDAEIAKKSNIFDEKSKYGAIELVAGQSFLLPGLDRQIVGLEIGKIHKLTIPSEDAYGKKKQDLILSFPVRKLKASGIKPKKGEKVRNKNQLGTIIAIKEGRARVDFNHEFAGKDLEFDIKIIERVEDESKRIFLIVNRNIAALKEEDFKYEANEDDKSISLELSLFLLLTDGLQNIILRLISDLRQNFGYQKIEFKFGYDFSEISKEEKKLEKALTVPALSSNDSENKTEE